MRVNLSLIDAQGFASFSVDEKWFVDCYGDALLRVHAMQHGPRNLSLEGYGSLSNHPLAKSLEPYLTSEARLLFDTTARTAQRWYISFDYQGYYSYLKAHDPAYYERHFGEYERCEAMAKYCRYCKCDSLVPNNSQDPTFWWCRLCAFIPDVDELRELSKDGH